MATSDLTEDESTEQSNGQTAIITQLGASGKEIPRRIKVDEVMVHGDGLLKVVALDESANGGSVIHRQVASLRFTDK